MEPGIKNHIVVLTAHLVSLQARRKEALKYPGNVNMVIEAGLLKAQIIALQEELVMVRDCLHE